MFVSRALLCVSRALLCASRALLCVSREGSEQNEHGTAVSVRHNCC